MAETYTVLTEDGYASQLYRIPGKAGEAAPSQAKPAVFMMAGVECDMNFWTANDPTVTPAFVLAEQGYDVWLGNNRGTRFANYHVNLSASHADYWNFSQEDMGLKDLPALFDYVLNKTG